MTILAGTTVNITYGATNAVVVVTPKGSGATTFSIDRNGALERLIPRMHADDNLGTGGMLATINAKLASKTAKSIDGVKHIEI